MYIYFDKEVTQPVVHQDIKEEIYSSYRGLKHGQLRLKICIEHKSCDSDITLIVIVSYIEG